MLSQLSSNAQAATAALAFVDMMSSFQYIGRSEALRAALRKTSSQGTLDATDASALGEDIVHIHRVLDYFRSDPLKVRILSPKNRNPCSRCRRNKRKCVPDLETKGRKLCLSCKGEHFYECQFDVTSHAIATYLGPQTTEPSLSNNVFVRGLDNYAVQSIANGNDQTLSIASSYKSTPDIPTTDPQ